MNTHAFYCKASFNSTTSYYHAAPGVKSDLSSSFSTALHHPNRQGYPPQPSPLHTQPLSPAFAEALKLILPNIAIQLWSRALLQACNDRINGNIIGESYFIHVLLWKGQRATLRENVKIPEQVGDNAMRGIQREAWANNSIICSVKLARSL